MKFSSKERLSKIIKEKSRQAGFDFCGISRAEKLSDESGHLESWLSKGYHGKMAYMANHFEKRLDPSELVPGAKSVISLLYNYYPENEALEDSEFKVARYA